MACMQDCQELLKGREVLDSGTEKVVLIKMQRVLTWGLEAARRMKLQVGLQGLTQAIRALLCCIY